MENLNGTETHQATRTGILVGTMSNSNFKIVDEDLAEFLLNQGICSNQFYKFRILIKSAVSFDPIILRIGEFVLFSYEESDMVAEISGFMNIPSSIGN